MKLPSSLFLQAFLFCTTVGFVGCSTGSHTNSLAPENSSSTLRRAPGSAAPGSIEPDSVATASVAGSNVNLSLEFAGVERSYVLHIPGSYNAGSKFPLLLAFHPNNGTGAGLQKLTGLDAVADKAGFLVAYPDSNPKFASGKDWQTNGSNSDVDFSVKMLEAIESRYSVDTTKIAIGGYSKGGGMVEQLACQHADLFTGAVIVAANLNAGIVRQCHPSRQIPFLFFHGTADPVSPYTGGANGGVSGGATYSALQTAQYWANANGCSTAAPSSANFADVLSGGSSTVDTKQAWTCPAHASVIFYTIGNGGHTWPGGTQKVGPLGPISQNLNASEVLSQFLYGTAP